MSREWKPGDVAVAEVGEYLTWDGLTERGPLEVDLP